MHCFGWDVALQLEPVAEYDYLQTDYKVASKLQMGAIQLGEESNRSPEIFTAQCGC